MGFFDDIFNRQDAGTIHRNQFVDFRVFLYRLNIPGSISVPIPTQDGVIKKPALGPLLPGEAPRSVTLPVNEFFGIDFSDHRYEKIIEALSRGDGAAFREFMNQYYARVLDAVYDPATGNARSLNELLTGVDFPGGGAVNSEFPVFREIDITPLVQTVRTSLSLEGSNSCSINIFDPEQADFSQIELSRLTTPRVFRGTTKSTNLLDELKALKFREFDMIRVYAYGRTDDQKDNAPRRRLDKLRSIFTAATVPEAEGFDELSAKAEDFLFSPAFTGVVSTIQNRSVAGQVSTIDLNCMGMMRMFQQSVTVYSESVANVIESAGPELSLFSDKKINVMENRFSDKRTDDILKEIFSEYLHPRFLPDFNSDARLAAARNNSIAVPDLNTIKAELEKDLEISPPGSSAGTTVKAKKLIPMLPTIILYHILKLRHRELILSFDDRLDGFKEYTSPSDAAAFEVTTRKEPGELDAELDPYLDFFRDSFSVWDASYQSAGQIFETIRNTTFMEIFEDRTGQFHFRFPRYNVAQTVHNISPSDIIESSVAKSDSGIYNATVSHQVLKFVGASTVLDGKVFLDKFSILKLGMRTPQINENPNANGPESAAVLAKFNRAYYANRNSRTGLVRKLGNPAFDVGRLVFFRVGRKTPTEVMDTIGEGNTFAGYIVGISEYMSVSGEYVQELELAFVRDADIVEETEKIPFSGTLWDFINFDADMSQSELQSALLTIGTQPPLITADTIEWLRDLTLTPKKAPRVLMKHVPSAFEVADEFAKLKTRREAAQKKALENQEGGTSDLTVADLDKSIDSIDARIAQEKRTIAMVLRGVRILGDEYLKVISDKINDAINTRSGVDPSRPGAPVSRGKLLAIGRELKIELDQIVKSLLSQDTESVSFFDPVKDRRISEDVELSTAQKLMPFKFVFRLVNKSLEAFSLRFNFRQTWKKYFVQTDQPSLISGNGLKPAERTRAIESLRIFKERISLAVSEGRSRASGDTITALLEERKRLTDLRPGRSSDENSTSEQKSNSTTKPQDNRLNINEINEEFGNVGIPS